MIKKLLKKYIFKFKLVKKLAIATVVNENLFASVINNINPIILRENLFLPKSKFSSQNNQDIFALLINKFKEGFFIEIGANDGFTFSNTIYLEENFNWKGILIEANPLYTDSLSKRKNSFVINQAVYKNSGTIDFFDAGLYGGIQNSIDPLHSKYTSNSNIIKVPCNTLDNMLLQYNKTIPDIIDFVSIDIEGLELIIIKQLLSMPFKIRCGVVEVNKRSEEIKIITSLLIDSGYIIDSRYSVNQDLYFYNQNLL
jgi:FkbM family methyltransferase